MLIRLLKTYLKPYSGFIAVVIVLQIGASIASVFLPRLNADIIDLGVLKRDIGYIWRAGAIMLAVSAVQVICQVTAARIGSQVAMAFGRDVRADIFGRALSFSTRELNKFGAPSLITRNTNDVQQVQQLVMMTLIVIIGAPIMMVSGVVMAIRENAGLSWTILVGVIVLAAAIGAILVNAIPEFRKQQTRIDTLNRVLREQITGIRVVRAFVREPYERERFDRANSELTETATILGRLMAWLFPIVMFVMNLSTVAVTWFAAHRIDSGEMQIGSLTAFLAYLMQILFSVMMSTMMIMLAPRAAVCAVRIAEVLDTRSTVVSPEHPVTHVDQQGRVEFRDVAFCYPGAEVPVLSNITFDLEPGRTTAVIGSTGSGKTTLVNLVPRLFDATGGRVLVDGVDVRDLDPEVLWGAIGLVPQRPYLFSGTVRSNLKYGKPDATDDEMWAALRTAQAADFVERMDGGLDAPIAQGGTNVSGGQRQRLSIARALVKRPDVYVFDDSFSALDVATDARLRAALATDITDAATLVVAQRVSTIRNADEIIVLEDGRIVGQGTHDQLLETCPTYLEIVQSQLSAEEAAA